MLERHCVLHLALNLFDKVLMLDLSSDYETDIWSVKCYPVVVLVDVFLLHVINETNTNRMLSIILPVAPSTVQKGKKKWCRDIGLNLQRKW